MATIIFSDQMKQPYSEWATEALQAMAENKPISIGLVAMLEDGQTFTFYWNCNCEDKSRMSQHIQSDYIDQLVSANFSKYLAEHGIEVEESDETE